MLLCSNFVKFCSWDIGKIVRYLPDKKFLKLSLLPGSRPESAKNVLEVLEISSKSVHFRRSYSRTREHREIAP